jgi:hypothetical protein
MGLYDTQLTNQKVTVTLEVTATSFMLSNAIIYQNGYAILVVLQFPLLVTLNTI